MLAEVTVLLFATVLAQEPKPTAPPAEPTITLEGRVVDLRGEPMPAAKVWVVTWREPDTVLARGTCDGDGCFRIGHVPALDSVQVLATAAGKNIASVGARATSTVLHMRLHDAATVSGVLRDAKGAPVGGVIVRAADLARGLESADCYATTGEDGAFHLKHVPLGPLRIATAVPGEGQYLASLLVAGDAEVDLARAPDPTTALRIVVAELPAGAAARVTISLLPNGVYSRLPPPWQRPTLEADGTCSLRDLPDTDYKMQLMGPGLVFAPATLTVKAGEGPHEVRFTASPIDSVEQQCPARLCDSDGKPIGKVTLSMRAANSLLRAEATSDGDGKLVFASHLASGAEVVVESRDDRWVLDQKKREDRLDDRRMIAQHACTVDPRTTLELRAIAACSVAGRLLMPDGSPAAFVGVALEEENPTRLSRGMAVSRTTTDRNGHFRVRRVHHVAEPLRILVEAIAGSGTSEPFQLAKAGDVVTLPELKLRPPASIEGVVLDGQQRPAPGVRVWLRGQQKSGSIVEVITDRAGRYRFLGVPPGGAWLELLVGADKSSPSGRAVEPFEVEAGKTYTHDLQVPAK